MKKKLPILSAMLFFSILSVTFFASCDKDTHSYLDVKVVDAFTEKAISGAEIWIHQTGGSIDIHGVTGSNGVYSHRFNAPANIEIEAKLALYHLDSAYTPPMMVIDGYRTHSTRARLVDGETVTRVIKRP